MVSLNPLLGVDQALDDFIPATKTTPGASLTAPEPNHALHLTAGHQRLSEFVAQSCPAGR